MALLGGVLLNVVYADKPDRQTTVSQHPIEDGNSVADHVERKPLVLSISGVVTGPDAASRLTKLEDMQKKGQLLTYTNRVRYDNMVIESFGTEHGKEVANGFLFSMTLVRVRIMQSSPVKGMALPQRVQSKPVTNKGRQQTKKGPPSPMERRAAFLRNKGLE